MVMVMSLQASGDIKGPVTIGLLSMWLVSVAGAYFFGIILDFFGLIGIWIAMMLDECLRALIFIYRWHSGVWRHKNLI